MTLEKVVLRVPVLRTPAVMLFRLRLALRYTLPPVGSALSWLDTSREPTNFTYDLTESNTRHLAATIAVVLDRSPEEIYGYLRELESDSDLRRHIRAQTLRSAESYKMDPEPRYGRRLGWYAFARAMKPRVVVETGVDKGLGACVLCAALLRNAEDGHPGTYYGTDINPAAGVLLAGAYATTGKILYGDSIQSLQALNERVDLFINDSDHSAGYEAAEYRTIGPRMSERGIILGDNSHVTDALVDFALATGRHFLFFAERPRAHWYPGGGIGIAFRK